MIPGIGPATAAKAIKALSACSDPFLYASGADFAGSLPARARERWSAISENLVDIAGFCGTDEPGMAISTALDGPYVEYMSNKYENFESRLDDLKQLALFAKRFESTGEFLSEISLSDSVAEDTSEPDDNDDDSVILSTVHQAKGLEWSVVFVIGLAEGLFPSSKVETPEEMEEERRLFYVAVTRAKREVHLCFPLHDGSPWQGGDSRPSRFLEEIDDGLFEFDSPAGGFAE